MGGRRREGEERSRRQEQRGGAKGEKKRRGEKGRRGEERREGRGDLSHSQRRSQSARGASDVGTPGVRH